MRKLLKILLPPFIGFTLLFIAVRYSSDYYTLRMEEIGEGKLRGFMAYYRYFLPLLFLTGVVTQSIVAVPWWDKVITGSAKFFSFLLLSFICLLFSAGMAYAIWDHQNAEHLAKICLFMTGVQVAYWIINMIIMYLIDKMFGDKEIKEAE